MPVVVIEMVIVTVIVKARLVKSTPSGTLPRAPFAQKAPRGARVCLALAQDRGGPSKGGFLNNRLPSYTDIYIYIYIYIFVQQLRVFVYKQVIIQENDRLFRKPPLLGPPLSLPDTSYSDAS